MATKLPKLSFKRHISFHHCSMLQFNFQYGTSKGRTCFYSSYNSAGFSICTTTKQKQKLTQNRQESYFFYFWNKIIILQHLCRNNLQIEILFLMTTPWLELTCYLKQTINLTWPCCFTCRKKHQYLFNVMPPCLWQLILMVLHFVT